MGSPFLTPEFKKLFRYWNKRLEKAGHKEIEDFSRENPPLKKFETCKWNFSDPLRNEWRQQYYEMAEVVLKIYPFQDDKQRFVWALHCEGVSIRDIATQARRERIRGLYRDRVHRIIREIEKRTGLTRG